MPGLEIPIEIDPTSKKGIDRWADELGKKFAGIGDNAFNKLFGKMSNMDRNPVTGKWSAGLGPSPLDKLSMGGGGIDALINRTLSDFQKGGVKGGLKGMFGTEEGAAGAVGNVLGGGKMLGSMGKMLGTAIGGPIVGAVGQYVAEKIPDAIAGPAKLATGALRGVGDSLKGLQGLLGPVDVGFDLIGKGMGLFTDKIKSIPLVGEVVGPMLDQFTMMPGLIKDITHSLTSMAIVASPAAGKQLELATRDVQGVIGQSFLPVLQMMTKGIRFAGDVIATVLPSYQDVSSALSGLRGTFSEFGDTIKQLLKDVGPEMKSGLIEGLRIGANAMSLFVKGLDKFAKGVDMAAKIIGTNLRMVGINNSLGLGLGSMKSARGAGSGQASFDSFEGYEQKLQQGAYSSGAMTMDQVPNFVSGISKGIDILVSSLQWMTEEGLKRAVAAVIPGGKTALDLIQQSNKDAKDNPLLNPRGALGPLGFLIP
jgi:hypothetical protein